MTPYGQWAHCLAPGAADLYHWLSEQNCADLIVVSNFHDYIALETKIPALPIPKDVPTLKTWVEGIRRSRHISNPRILFVLDPDNHWRDYWIPPPTEIIQTFGLKHQADTPTTISAHVFEYRS